MFPRFILVSTISFISAEIHGRVMTTSKVSPSSKTQTLVHVTSTVDFPSSSILSTPSIRTSPVHSFSIPSPSFNRPYMPSFPVTRPVPTLSISRTSTPVALHPSFLPPPVSPPHVLRPSVNLPPFLSHYISRPSMAPPPIPGPPIPRPPILLPPIARPPVPRLSFIHFLRSSRPSIVRPPILPPPPFPPPLPIPLTPIPHSSFVPFIHQAPRIISPMPITSKQSTSEEFPLHKHLGLNIHEKLPYEYVNLCSIPWSRDVNLHRCCECDDNCMMYGTCCIDKLWKFNHTSYEHYITNFEKERSRFKALSCERLLPIINNLNETYYMVASCPPNSNATISSKCTSFHGSSFFDMMPVIEYGYVYRNKFCALCNNANMFQYFTMDVKCMQSDKLEGKSSVDMDDIQNMNSCVVNPVGDFRNYFKKCKKDMFQCDKGNKNYKLCNAYYGPFSSTSGRYRNYHCFKCNDNDTGDILSISRDTSCSKTLCEIRPCDLPNGKEYSQYTFTFKLQPDRKSSKVLLLDYGEEFPIRQFLDIPRDYKFPVDQGLDQYLCSSSERKKCCECSKDCIRKKQACCIDVFWNKTEPVKLETYLNDFLNKSRSQLIPTCEYVYPLFKRDSQTSDSKFMVKSCPYGVDNNSVLNCHYPSAALSHNIPVIGDDEMMYANVGCALCNGVINYEFVNITLECRNFHRDPNDTNNTTDLAKELINEASQCIFKVIGRAESFESCTKTTDARPCHVFNKHYELCNLYKGSIYGYLNYHCSKCHDEDKKFNQYELFLEYCERKGEHPPPPWTVQPSTPGLGNKGSWSMLISFVGKSVDIRIESDREEVWDTPCGKGESFDIDTFSCVKRCSPNQYKVNGVCKKIINRSTVEKMTNSSFDRCLMARGSKLYVVLQRNSSSAQYNFIKTFQQLVFSNATFHLKSNNSLYQSNEDLNQTYVKILELQERITLNVLKNLTEELNSPSSKLWEMIHNYFVTTEINSYLINKLYNFHPVRYFPEDKLCSQYEELDSSQAKFEDKCDVTFQNVTTSYENISMWTDLKEGITGMAVCKQFHLTKLCPRILLPENITIDRRSYTITVPATFDNNTITFSPEDYEPTANGYVICRKSNRTIFRTAVANPVLITLSDIEEKMSLIGTSVSIVSYIWIIATYLGFKDLRTLPGYSYAFMCVYLLLADSLFITAVKTNSNHSSCTALAVLLHWSLIGSFIWTFVIAFDLVLKFTSFSTRSSHDSIRQVKRRVLVTFLVPTLYIAILVGLDQSSTVSIEYGTAACWINNYYARLGLYVVPIALISLATFSMLIFTIVKIRKDQAASKDVLRVKRKSNLLRIAFKLVVILASTELIGYIQIPNPTSDEEVINAVFSFIYVVTRSLRGVMLFLVLIIGGGLIRKYNKQFQKSIRKKTLPKQIPSQLTTTTEF